MQQSFYTNIQNYTVPEQIAKLDPETFNKKKTDAQTLLQNKPGWVFKNSGRCMFCQRLTLMKSCGMCVAAIMDWSDKVKKQAQSIIKIERERLEYYKEFNRKIAKAENNLTVRLTKRQKRKSRSKK